MRLGLLGGTFDPVHYGHLLLAESCREQCRLDQVWFLPAAVAPHKRQVSCSPGPQRVDMLRLAIGGHESFDVCELELARGGVSYTVDTLRQLRSADPERELFLLLGADTLVDLPNWHEPDEICTLALPVVVGRPGTASPDFHCLSGVASPERIEKMRQNCVDMPLVELSSSDIRRRVSQGRSIRYMTPRAVEKFIEIEGLYRAPPS